MVCPLSWVGHWLRLRDAGSVMKACDQAKGKHDAAVVILSIIATFKTYATI
jgi:hypothetical protein